MSNIIRFPSRRMAATSELDARFHDETKHLSPELSNCLKEMFERVSAEHGQDLPSLELRVSGDLGDAQTDEIRTAVASLMDRYRERTLAMLKRIMELEAEICTLKFSRDAPNTLEQ